MTSLKYILASAAVLAGLALTSAYAQTRSVPEPSGLWHGPLHSATPATLQGATVVNGPRLKEIVAKDRPVMIDVSQLDRRPPSMRPDTPWSPIHRSLPEASWLPGAGFGTDDPEFAATFAAEAEKLTGGDKDKPIVTFCHPNRWGSWNVGKRLVQLGYKNVYWFPGGAEGWAETGQRLYETKPAKVFKVDGPKIDPEQKSAASTPK